MSKGEGDGDGYGKGKGDRNGNFQGGVCEGKGKGKGEGKGEGFGAQGGGEKGGEGKCGGKGGFGGNKGKCRVTNYEGGEISSSWDNDWWQWPQQQQWDSETEASAFSQFIEVKVEGPECQPMINEFQTTASAHFPFEFADNENGDDADSTKGQPLVNIFD